MAKAMTNGNVPAWVRKATENARIELESIGTDSQLKKGDRGTVILMNQIGNILVKWDNGLIEQLVHNRDKYWILQTVTVVCYGQKEVWDSREEAMAYYLEGMMACDGSEADRYRSIYCQLADGARFASDNY